MNGAAPDSVLDGALAACTACAVQLGADPMVAPLIAAAVAVALRHAVPALAQALLSRRAPPPPAAS